MDDEQLQQAFARIEAGQKAMLGQLNDKLERILNRVVSLESDFQNTKGFLIGDAALSSRRWLDLDARVTKIEDELRGKAP